jgi:hypothetical protein
VPSLEQAAGRPAASRGPLLAPALSLVVPGAGQHLLGQRRKWVYLALEVGALAFFVERRVAGGNYRDRYRDFAWENGRLQTAVRLDGGFAYYETLTHWTRSGVFDADAVTAGVQPEVDTATFNGSVWSLATRIFLPGGNPVPMTDPAYLSALAYYGEHAYGADMLWDWSGSPGAQSEFSRLVDESDRRYRHATATLGVVIANHLVSAVDAYLASRGAPATGLRFLPERAPGSGWTVALELPAPR